MRNCDLTILPSQKTSKSEGGQRSPSDFILGGYVVAMDRGVKNP